MTIIFDFDGTLADSYTIMLALYNAEAQHYGVRPLSADDWEMIRRMKFGEILKFIGIKPRQVPNYLALGKQVLRGHTDQIPLFEGIVEMVSSLQQAGHDLYVLSSNAEDTIQTVLNHYGISYMTVMKSSKMFGKAAPLRRLVRSKKLEAEQTWMVGDEVRDIVAAHKAGIQSIAVTWGFHPREMLKPTNPVTYADTPQQITSFFEK